MPRLLLLIPSTSYRVSDFVSSAHRLGVDVTVGSNEAQVLESISNGGTISIDFKETKLAISTIEKFNKKYPGFNFEVCGRFMRRGGIDINPIRSNKNTLLFKNFRVFNQ